MLKIAAWKNKIAIREVISSGRVVATREANVMASNQRGGGAQATVEALVWDGEHWLLAKLPKFDFGREPLRTPHHVGWAPMPPAEALHWAIKIASQVDLDGDREGWTKEAITRLVVGLDERATPLAPRAKKLAICPDCGSRVSIIAPNGAASGFIHLPSCPQFRGNRYPLGYTTGEGYK